MGTAIATSISTLPSFMLFFAVSMILFVAFSYLYMRFTPYDEVAQVREGDLGAALSLSGALLGYSLAYGSAVIHSTGVLDMVIWAIIAGVIQLLAFTAASRLLFPAVWRERRMPNTAVGMAAGSVSLVIGIINASCISY